MMMCGLDTICCLTTKRTILFYIILLSSTRYKIDKVIKCPDESTKVFLAAGHIFVRRAGSSTSGLRCRAALHAKTENKQSIDQTRCVWIPSFLFGISRLTSIPSVAVAA